MAILMALLAGGLTPSAQGGTLIIDASPALATPATAPADPSAPSPVSQSDEAPAPAAGHPYLALAIFLTMSMLALTIAVRLGLHRPSPRRPAMSGGLPHPRPGTAPALLLGMGLGLWVIQHVGGAVAQQCAPSDAGPLMLQALSLTGMYTAAGLALGLLLTRGIITREAIGLAIQPRDVLTALASLALAAPILLLVGGVMMQLVVILQSGQAPDRLSHETLRALHTEGGAARFMVMLLVTLGAPFFEEVIFRGFIQTAMRSAAGPGVRSAWLAIIMTSLAFTVIHADAVAWYALPILMALSIVLGLAFERTGRLGVPIVIHGTFNLLQLLLSLS